MQIDWKQLGFVAGAGGLGGLLYWVYSEAIKTPLGLGWFGSPVASLFLGMGAGVLGVYLIAKTDMSAQLHALAFAMACGLAWRPVLEGAGAAVEAQITAATEASIEESTGEAVAASQELTSEDGESPEALDAAVTRSVDALRRDPRRTAVAEDRSASLEQVVQNIQFAKGLDVQTRIDGLRTIGEAAATAGDHGVAFSTMAAIKDLADSNDLPDSTKERAADAVQDIGARGGLRTMQSLRVNANVIQEAIQPSGKVDAGKLVDQGRLRPPPKR